LAQLTLPAILNIPDKLIPIITEINKYRYFLIEGGRGGGKSQSIGRLFLYLAEQKNLRMVCGRETQNSINESVYSLLADLIRNYQLCFDIHASKITHKETQTSINFRGFREQGSFNIQGMEGIDILWIDEAQAITKQTLDVLIPTIRKDNAKIFFTMNRHVHNDPVFSKFVGRDDCLHIKINYDENKYCTQALKKEAEECRKKSLDDYNHIWLGDPLSRAEDCVFTHQELEDCKKNVYPLRQGYGLRLAGFDIARYGDDKCACVVIQQMGALHWEVCFVDKWEHKDLNYTTGRILTTSSEQKIDKSIIDEDGIGSGPLDTLRQGRGLDNFHGFRNPPINYKDNKAYGNARTLNTYKLKDLILKGHIHIKDEELLAELESAFRYTFDHNQRKILISKDNMRNKYQVKSPNLADALIMAISLIGDVKARQDTQYYRQPQSSREENLFNIAGVR
jgi:phage terminase large subunit